MTTMRSAESLADSSGASLVVEAGIANSGSSCN